MNNYLEKYRKRVARYQSLKNENVTVFFKKCIGISKKEYSSLEKNIRNKLIRIFNRENGTNFFIEWKKLGESDVHCVKKINASQLSLNFN